MNTKNKKEVGFHLMTKISHSWRNVVTSLPADYNKSYSVAKELSNHTRR